MSLLSPIDNLIDSLRCPLPPSPSPSSSPSSSSSSSSSSSPSSSPPPDTIRVVCNVPLLAPRPLPYHSPTFLQFDLPDTDEDLSHPPYTHRPPKRMRDPDDDPLPHPPPKRRPVVHRSRSRLPHRTREDSHRSANLRLRT